MTDTPHTPHEPEQRFDTEYEDSQYHDEDDVVPADDGQPRILRPSLGRKPARRIPPPKRRFPED
jgi:hypothetical protein